jgi:phosphofructokinase-like protein
MSPQRKKRRIALLTAGGDCPGINAVIRAVAKTAMNRHDMEVIGFEDGFSGLIHDRWRPLGNTDVSGILVQGGTILGTSNRDDPFRFFERKKKNEQPKDVSDLCVRRCKKMGIQALVAIGGDGTLSIANGLGRKGLPTIGVPKTIDNDVGETDVTFGFDTAVSIAAEAIDRLHTTAMSHHRVMIVEIMGRYAGWLTLHAGIAGGGDVLLLPEMPYDFAEVCRVVERRSRQGKRFSIIVASEGAMPRGGHQTVKATDATSTDPIRLGGFAQVLGKEITEATGLETRATILGHLQRGGSPTAFDRVLSTRFGTAAAELAAKGKTGRMVALQGNRIVDVAISRAVRKLKLVPPDDPLIHAARAIGTSFGDGK